MTAPTREELLALLARIETATKTGDQAYRDMILAQCHDLLSAGSPATTLFHLTNVDTCEYAGTKAFCDDHGPNTPNGATPETKR